MYLLNLNEQPSLRTYTRSKPLFMVMLVHVAIVVTGLCSMKCVIGKREERLSVWLSCPSQATSVNSYHGITDTRAGKFQKSGALNCVPSLKVSLAASCRFQ